MKPTVKVSLIASLAFGLFTLPNTLSLTGVDVLGGKAVAQERKTKKVPAMRERVYSQLARAQKIADEKGADEGLAVLDEVKERLSQMNSYERAMLWNFYGFTYYNAERTTDAIDSFEKVVSQVTIPESLMKSTLFSLAQLSMSLDDYGKTLDYLKRWQDVNGAALKPNEHLLFSQVYYQLKQYTKALEPINAAIASVEAEGKPAKENWLVLQRAIYFELKQPEKVTEVLEKMVHLFNKPKYWIQLAGMYGEIGQETKQMAVMESAWQAGYITKESDISTLAQLYLYNDIPYKGAVLMEEAVETGKVKRNLKTLEFIAQAWMMAKETERAIPVLASAAKLSDDGNNYARLAEVLVNSEKWEAAIDASNKALEKGHLKNEGNMYIAQGIAYFNMKSFDYSLASLKSAVSHKKVAKMAKQWASYVEKEKLNHEQIAMLKQ